MRHTLPNALRWKSPQRPRLGWTDGKRARSARLAAGANDGAADPEFGQALIKRLGARLPVDGPEFCGRVAVDVGASTGGFTETLLERGASRVFAVDVGRGQLHEKLSADPRVVVIDGVNDVPRKGKLRNRFR